MSQHIYIDRPPRIQPELPIDEIEIPAPPEKPDYGWTRFIQIGLPLITIIGYVLIGSLGGVGRSAWYILPMGFTVVASVAFSVYTYLKEKQRLAEITRAYSARLVELNKDMQMYHTMQRRFYEYNYPDFDEVERLTRNAYQIAQVTKPLPRRVETRVWERRTSDADFGAIRLGIGMLPSSVVYTADKIENFEDPQSREALKLQDDSRFVANIPVIISLRQPFQEEAAATEPPQAEGEDQEQAVQANRTPVAHAVSITGPAESVYPFARALLAHFAAFHAPSEARLFVLAQQQTDWGWIENLPHANTDTGPTTCFIHRASPPPGSASPGDALEPFLEGIRRTLAQRKIQLEDREEKGSTGDPTLPFLLIVVDLLETAYHPQSPLNLNKLEAEPAISFVLENGAQLGAAIIFLAPDRSKAPGGCRAVIEVAHVTQASNARHQSGPTIHFRYAEVGVNSFRYVGHADVVPDPARLKEFAALLANVRIREGVGGGLDRTVPFMRLMGYHSLEQLKKVTSQRWQASTQNEQADWLQAPIGLMAGNKPRSLIFSAKEAGVHGLVAGSTGSGKSELLTSLITALAVTYDPSVLNFVLVDYKGGGAFNDFKDLPHCVDLITNLAGEGVTRMFTAIQSELKRRQALVTESGAKDIVAYRQQGLHLKGGQPFPFLFIIIDEFAEMIADRPEYKAQLESITRIGRSLGVSLLLAAQRPSGVTDQMRANIKFRICLRVENPAESREMLRRSEAAYLPGDIPGRGYLQIGNDEIELFQAAFTGDKYDSSVDSSLIPVIWPKRDRIYRAEAVKDAPPLYQVIIRALKKLALDHNLPRQYAPWPEFLPDQLGLASLLISNNPNAKTITDARYLSGIDQIMLGLQADPDLYLNPAINKWLNNENGWLPTLNWEHYAARPVVGLVDNPHTAQQLPLVINLPVGHTAIFGASGWGKTTFIRSLLVSLMATHAPNALHVYVLDLGGRHFKALADFPHVGAVIIPDAEGYRERVEQLLRELDNIVNERKTWLSTSGASDVYQYNQHRPKTPLPVIVVAIDNFLEFQETFGSGREDAPDVLNKFIELARQGKPYGLHFVISATQPGILSNPLYNLFTERVTLKLADPTEYRAIVGGQVADVPATPGRGYVKLGHQPLSVQIARLFDAPTTAGENDDLARIAAQMQQIAANADPPYPSPLRVDALPKTVRFKQILTRQLDLALDEKFWSRLADYTRQNWQNSLDPTQTDWLTVTPGVISGNRLRPLHLAAAADGVHGLIAGGTGAGKSELLMTLIVDLALRYDPSILNFVLVDYKGGGAFQPFKDLPHCVDSITNLDKAAVKRMFTAITAEMERRQKLNTDTDTKDIIAYRKKGLHLNGGQPYPHLFIIIDEYAEMITNNPEFREELDSITRLGRSLGINLLLAAQRPIGVTDQMRANIKYRICLRVEQTETSREMLRRSDAAFLPTGMPGRGYLQIGNNNIELMQMAYTGDVEDLPLDHLLTAGSAEGTGRELRFFDAVVRLAQHLHADQARPRTPWPPPLPAQLTLADPANPAYMEPSAQLYLTQQQPDVPLAVNPFVPAWLGNRPGWPGVDWAKTAMRAVIGLVDDPYSARQLPLRLDFSRGHAALFGAAGYGKTTVLRTVVTSLAATHSPTEFQAHLIGGQNLAALIALPHVGSLILPDERGYEERVQQLLREFNDILDDRKRRFKEANVSTLYEYNSTTTPTLPAILLVIDNFAEFAETFGGDSKKDAADNLLDVFIGLARQGKAYGLHVLITVSRANSISGKLYSLFTERLALRLAEAGDYQVIVGSSVVEPNDIPGRGYAKVERRALEFQVAVAGGSFTEQGQLRGEMQTIKDLGEVMHRLGRQLWAGPEPLRIEALPEVSRFRDLLTDELNLVPTPSFVAELKTAMQANWQRTTAATQADWLKVPLGITSGNRPKTLHLAADKDGVHGLVAGGTGSGKSELLITMIAGLAIHYSPDILNFILVDYKGGGAFSAFERLPHCVGIVTNLNKSAVNRMFTAINAEIRRRQQLNTDTKTKDIIDYRKKGLHLSYAPYPHLFIIIDEYAEMISDNDAYRADLESITRVGRAQGVNLLLASQRPKGVTDQMRANIKYRLCLRVEQVDASRELLRRPDAAYLPNGIYGRGYLQVGNENLELLQVAYTGTEQPDDRPAPVQWPRRSQAETVITDPPRLFNTVVTLSSELYRGQMARKPWPDFLPTVISLQMPLFDSQQQQMFVLQPAVTHWLNGDNVAGLWAALNWETEAMRPVVGLLDDPAEARQSPLRLNLARSHLVVLGDTGWGRTALLRTIIVSLATTHSPNDLHIYVLDLGGRAFQNLEKLPHVGAVIYADEDAYEERLQRLLDRLTKLVEERQRLFSSAGAQSLYEYNARQPRQSLPAVLVIIDNFAELQENYEPLVESVLMPLARRSISLGLTFVASANVPNNMSSKLYNLFAERITFKQSNPDRYMDIVGRGAIELDEVPGRGYIRIGRRPLLFQAALPVGLFDADGSDSRLEATELQLLVSTMRQTTTAPGFIWRHQPYPIDILPLLAPLAHLLNQAETDTLPVQALIGQTESLEPALIDLKRLGPHFVIIGPPMSGKTTALYNYILSLAHRHPPSQVTMLLLDLERRFVDYGGQRHLGQLPHTLEAVTTVERLEALLPALKLEANRLAQPVSPRSLFIFIDNFDDFVDEVDQAKRELIGQLASLAGRYGRDGLHFVVTANAAVVSRSSDLWRRIQSSNYGLALRTEQALQGPLQLRRTPPAVQGKELPMGRGFLVRAGQPILLQSALPYELPGPDSTATEQPVSLALDNWIDQIEKRYPQQKAAWCSGDLPPSTTQAEVFSRQSRRVYEALQRYALAELTRPNGQPKEIAPKLLQINLEQLGSLDTLLPLLREAWAVVNDGGSDESKELATDLTLDTLLAAIENKLPLKN